MADIVTFEIKGGKELERKLRKLGPLGLETASGSLYRSGEKIMTKSKDRYCPVDTGNLRATGHVRPPEVTQNEVRVVLGYGGTAGAGGRGNTKDVGYAIVVHETNRNYKVGQWKYLETPIKESVNEIIDDLRDDVEEALETLA